MLKFLLSALFLACTFIVTAQTSSTMKKTLVSSKGDTVDTSKDVDTIIYKRPEIESEFPGGLRAWQDFLHENLSYPRQAVRKNIEGTVILQFIVCTDGTVCDIEAISGPEMLRKTAVDALKNTPNWKPAMQDGRVVKSYKKQPVIFRLKP